MKSNRKKKMGTSHVPNRNSVNDTLLQPAAVISYETPNQLVMTNSGFHNNSRDHQLKAPIMSFGLTGFGNNMSKKLD